MIFVSSFLSQAETSTAVRQRAKQIIEYREKNGRFNKIEDIMKISGIKEGMFEKIAPYITVS